MTGGSRQARVGDEEVETMTRARTWGLAGAATATLCALTLAATSVEGTGKAAEYRFRKPLVEGNGVGSLEDLRGTPVLIDFWGTR